MSISCKKPQNGKDKRPNFLHSVVCNALIVGDWVVLVLSRKSYLWLIKRFKREKAVVL